MAAKSRKAAFYVNGLTAVLLVIILAAVSLFASPPSPPSIAEFAPQAQQQIEEAPAEQSAESGLSGSVGGEREIVTIEEQAQAEQAAQQDTITIEGVPSSLNCVAWPDGSVTQTFDPQSPACIATWDGEAGNGGATSKGVNETEILVGVESFVANRVADGEALAEFFNSHYQFYGRRIRIVPYEGTGRSAEGARQAGAELGGLGVFAATNRQFSTNGDPSVWLKALADNKVIGVQASATHLTTGQAASNFPYTWSYGPTLDDVEANLARFICRTLPYEANAEYGGPDVSLFPRKLAIAVVTPSAGEDLPDLAPLQAGLAACGADPQVVQYITSVNDPTNQQLLVELQRDGVTSIIAFGTPVQFGAGLQHHAERIGYTPEWIIPGVDGVETPGNWRVNSPPNQSQHTFGLASWNRRLAPGSEPAYVAYQTAAPGQVPSGIMPRLYRELSMIAAGIQLAGPDLTPDTFAAGLQAARFPNPGAAAAPYYQATVGFAGDQTFVNDSAVFWWSNISVDPTEREAGTACLVNQGDRWRFDTWPSQKLPMFQAAC